MTLALSVPIEVAVDMAMDMDTLLVLREDFWVVVEADLIPSVVDLEGIDDLEAEKFVVAPFLVVVTQDDVLLLPRELGSDLGIELGKTCVPAEEEIT